jgi:diguanylate cyclase (GGDEF)-like protein
MLDLGMVVAIVVVLGYIAFDIDIFVTEGVTSPVEQTIELDEALLIGTVLMVGLLFFAARRYWSQKREMRRRIAAERYARELAYQDPLTGLANRRQLEEALRTAAASPPRAGAVHAVLMLDLNGFKQINDTYGHGIGDEVLIIVAQRLLRAVRDGDLVARLGGDEFVVLAQHLLSPQAAASIAHRIIESLSGPIMTGGTRHEARAGIGIALLPSDAQTVDEAIRKADVALYRAKAEQRSTFRFFEESMDRMVQDRDRLEHDLREAMASGHIQPRLRPSFNLRSGAVVGFEVVPSWILPDGTDVPPERFLPVAEDTGLIHDLARGLLESACRAAATWPDSVTLSMDILPGQLKDRALAQTILQSLRDGGLAPARLEIEITESTVVRELEAAKAALVPLRDAGVTIVLDNFGTGYSNLYHMQELPLDKVKIDRSFTKQLGHEAATKMVRALAGLGRGLGLAVSAEGLDGPVAGPALLSSGVEQGQTWADLVTIAESDRFFRAGFGAQEATSA